MSGKIYMIPTTLGDSPVEKVIPVYVLELIRTTKYFIVENVKTSRRYLKKVDPSINIDALTFFTLNKHTKEEDIISFITPALEGINIGIISEAGCPGIADPGSSIVEIAHKKNIAVVPLVGPSSILLALISSGMNGQKFTFHGYLSKDKSERTKEIKKLEARAGKGETQIFMETPYRNMQLLEDVIKSCNLNQKLCIALNITLENEFIKTKTIKEWKNKIPDLNKQPCIFILGL